MLHRAVWYPYASGRTALMLVLAALVLLNGSAGLIARYDPFPDAVRSPRGALVLLPLGALAWTLVLNAARRDYTSVRRALGPTAATTVVVWAVAFATAALVADAADATAHAVAAGIATVLFVLAAQGFASSSPPDLGEAGTHARGLARALGAIRTPTPARDPADACAEAASRAEALAAEIEARALDTHLARVVEEAPAVLRDFARLARTALPADVRHYLGHDAAAIERALARIT